MSRVIKFRVWDNAAQTYVVNPFLGAMPMFMLDLRFELNWIDDSFDGQILKGYVFEQFTGVQDSKGQDIYEGDVVRRWRHRPESNQYGAAEDYPASVGQVQYIPEWGRFRVVGPGEAPIEEWRADLHDGHSFWSDQSYIQLEVIGNVRQHPELLSPST